MLHDKKSLMAFILFPVERRKLHDMQDRPQIFISLLKSTSHVRVLWVHTCDSERMFISKVEFISLQFMEWYCGIYTMLILVEGILWYRELIVEGMILWWSKGMICDTQWF
jgi:hypothetical protein